MNTLPEPGTFRLDPPHTLVALTAQPDGSPRITARTRSRSLPGARRALGRRAPDVTAHLHVLRRPACRASTARARGAWLSCSPGIGAESGALLRQGRRGRRRLAQTRRVAT